MVLASIARAVKVAGGHMNKNAAVYGLGLVVVFTFAYKLMGLERHFDVPDYIDKGKRNSWTNCLYVSAMAQSNAMPDYTPKTTVARVLFMLQVVSGWFWFLMFTGNVFES